MPNQSHSARAALSGDYIPCSFDVIEHACLHSLHEQPSWRYSWLCTALPCIYSTYTHHQSIVISAYCADYRSSRRHRAIALLAPSLFETYHTSLLHARRHICSNPLELLRSHLRNYCYWTPCDCSLTWHLWRASRSHHARSHHARVCLVM